VKYFWHQSSRRKKHFVSAQVYEKLAYRGTSEGIIGIYKAKNLI
jgi:TrmH family RNA methyltransferase